MVERLDVPAEAREGYSIRVASRLSGVSSDTLRMWERRYGFPKPSRNGSQVRVYTDADIERLVLISRALKAGYRSGEVVHRGAEALRAMLVSSPRASEEGAAQTPTVESLLARLLADDPETLRDELGQSVALLGPKRFLTDIAAPFVDLVGEAWANGRIAVRHKHLFSEALSSKLRQLLAVYEIRLSEPVVLLTTLSGEQHGLGLDMVALYLSLAGATPRLLGVNTPADQVANAALALKPDVVGISVSEASDVRKTELQLRHVLSLLPAEAEVWVGGKHARNLTLRDARLQQVVTWYELDQAIARKRR